MNRISTRTGIRIVAGLILLFAVVEGIFLILDWRKEERAKEELATLVELTRKTFPSGRPSVREVFWRAAGRSEPDKDPWGTYYDISLSTTAQAYDWRSAGPDKTYRTEDDIVISTPLEK